VLAILGSFVGIAAALAHTITRQIPANGFGLCTGMQQPGYATPALTEWLADTIDRVAGRPTGDRDPPLTFGDLKNRAGAPPITLAIMTTNLMMQRPHRLPFAEDTFLFNQHELKQLVPARVFDHIMQYATQPSRINAPPDTYFHLPDADQFPVVLAARMSLSFPVLISTIPLYARDFTLLDEQEQLIPRLCLFSDGGLSSNFPIHFFDHLWPNTPTFAITLDEFDPLRNSARAAQRVWIPQTARSGAQLPIIAMGSTLIGFLMRMIDTAKDWQDNLQSTLPGYRERIVHVPLTAGEGGLNLGMNTETINTLIGYGADAGRLATTDFDLREHCWRRFLVAMARVEQTVNDMERAYDTPPLNVRSFREFLDSCAANPPSTYPQTPAQMDELLRRAHQIVELSREWRDWPDAAFRIPKPDTDLRITPKP
jgi:predicted acylesterase/phospholipase RssA